MWHDTIRFVRCAKDAFELPAPVHEFGLNALGAPLVTTEEPGSHLPEPSDDGPEDVSRIQPLDEMAQLPYQDGCAGTVACLNVLQHVTDPAAVAAEMIRLLAPGGILLVCSCTGGRSGANADLLWRPAPHAFQKLLAPLEATLIGWQGREGDPHSIYALGCKAPVSPKYLAGANRFLRDFRQTLAREQQAVPWLEKAREWLARISGRPTTGRARADYYHSQFVMHAPLDAQLHHDVLANCLQMPQLGSRIDLTQ
jgi:SAM-dependent methyltransferase